MLKKPEALRATLVVLMSVMIVLVSYFAIKHNKDTAGTSTVDEQPNAYYYGSRYRNFASDDLGISFTYPASWGDLTQWVAVPQNDSESNRMEATISTNDQPFLALVSGGTSTGHNGWWGDIAQEASSEDAVRLFCDTYKENDAYYVQPTDACEILVNDNGVTFARLRGSTSWFGWDLEDTYVYITFHPGNPFYGIALSAQSLRRTNLEDTLGNTEKAVQEIANSLSFSK